MANTNQMTREQAQLNNAEKARIRKLQAADIGAYAAAIGVLPRYLCGAQWNPSKKRRANP